MRKFYMLATFLLALIGCSEDKTFYINPIPEGGGNSGSVDAELGIRSDNTWFEAEDDLNATINFKSLGGEVVVDIQTNTTWEATSDAEWLTVEQDNQADQLILSCENNLEEAQQQATVTITAGDKSATIRTTQNAYGTLEIIASKNNFQIPACGELTAEFEVQSTDEDWVFETEGCTWLLVERDGDKILLTLDPNEVAEDREVSFQLIAGKNSTSPATETIRVMQERAAELTTSLQTIPFAATPSKAKEITVDANFEWSYTSSAGSDWLSITRTETGLEVSAEINPETASRSATITVTTGDGKANVAERVITVSQSGFDFDALILGLNVTASDLRARLPLSGDVQVTIDWGDGTVEENVTTKQPQHQYTDPDYYVVSVKGTVTALDCSGLNLSSYNQTDQIVEVYNWGRTGLTSMEGAFYHCTNLAKIDTDRTEAFAKVTTFEQAFYYCENLAEIPQGLLDNAGELLTVDDMFYQAEIITSVPADLLANCPKLTSVNSLFNGTAIESIDGNIFANNPELTDAGLLFANTTALKSVPANLFANNKKITDLKSLFASSVIESVPEGLFDGLTNVETFYMTFQNTVNLRSIPAGIFADTPNVTNFKTTFSGSGITEIPDGLFAGCSKVETFMSCFNNCANLQRIPANVFKDSGAFTTVEKDGFNNIFKGCVLITEVPEGLFDGFVNATQFNSAFEGCTSLVTLPAGLFNTEAISFSNTFKGCTALKSLPQGVLRNMSKVTSFSGLFSDCTGLEEIGANILEGCTSCTNISSMFKGCTNLKTISPDAFAGATAITTIASLFDGCTSLETVPEGLFAPMTGLKTASNVFSASGITSVPAGLFASNPAITTFSKIFYNCTSLVSLPDGLFASNPLVTIYTSAFEGCTALESVGVLFGPSTASVKCDNLFYGCTALKTLPEGIFTGLTGASTFEEAFYGCSALETLPAGLFEANVNVTTVTKCFQDCIALKAVPSRMFGVSTKTKTLSYLFDGCTSLETIAVDAFSGLAASSTTFMYAFQDCTSLQEVPDGLLKNNSTISTYTSMFRGCTGLRRLGSESLNCTSVTTALTSMFDGCTSLEEIGDKPFVNPVKLTSLSGVFKNCSALKSVPADIFDDCKLLKTVTNLFSGCTSLSGESPYTVVNGQKYHLYERTAETAAATGLTAITNSKSCFLGCTQLSDYAQIPDAWKQ